MCHGAAGRGRLLGRELRPGDVNGQKAAVRRVGVVFGQVAVEHHVAGLQHRAIAFDQLSLQDQELFVAVVAMRAGLHAGGHAVDMEPLAQGLVVVKLQDGVRMQESTKVELKTYARTQGVKEVKPFMLVIARDTTHAGDLLAYLQTLK